MELKVPFLYISFSDAAHIINLRCNKMRGATSGAGTAYTSGAPEFNPFICWICVTESLISV